MDIADFILAASLLLAASLIWLLAGAIYGWAS